MAAHHYPLKPSVSLKWSRRKVNPKCSWLQTSRFTFHGSQWVINPSDPEQQMESRRSVSDAELNSSDVQQHRSHSSRVSGAHLVEPHLKLLGDCWTGSVVVGGNIHSRKPAGGNRLRLSSVAPPADRWPASREEPDPVLHSWGLPC